jgi:hypothetical protein
MNYSRPQFLPEIIKKGTWPNSVLLVLETDMAMPISLRKKGKSLHQLKHGIPSSIHVPCSHPPD